MGDACVWFSSFVGLVCWKYVCVTVSGVGVVVVVAVLFW